MGEWRLDTRPSDAIALAMRLNAPLSVSESVLDEVRTFPIIQLDEDDIDAAVERRRDLEELTPADFTIELPPPTGPAEEAP